MHPFRTGPPVTKPPIAIVGCNLCRRLVFPFLNFSIFHFFLVSCPYFRSVSRFRSFTLSRAFDLYPLSRSLLNLSRSLFTYHSLSLSLVLALFLARRFSFLVCFELLLSWFLATNLPPLYFFVCRIESFFFFFSKCNRDLYKNVHLLRLIVIVFFSRLRYNNILYVYGSTDVRLHCNSNVCHE